MDPKNQNVPEAQGDESTQNNSTDNQIGDLLDFAGKIADNNVDNGDNGDGYETREDREGK